MRPNYFGSPPQQTLLRRGRAMYDLIGEDPRFTYYGRTVGIYQDKDAPLEQLVNLARLQGNASYSELPADLAKTYAQDLQEQGLAPVFYARWEGGETVLAAARQTSSQNRLPDDLTLHRVTADTDPALLAALADTALACGVLPPSIAALAGDLKPAVTLFATDPQGQVVSLAAASAYLANTHPHARDTCWWGMLATHPDHRGKRLSLILGALVIEQMHDSFGFTGFFTGVEPGNVPSEAVCARLGLVNTGRMILGVADPEALPGGRMTK